MQDCVRWDAAESSHYPMSYLEMMDFNFGSIGNLQDTLDLTNYQALSAGCSFDETIGEDTDFELLFQQNVESNCYPTNKQAFLTSLNSQQRDFQLEPPHKAMTRSLSSVGSGLDSSTRSSPETMKNPPASNMDPLEWFVQWTGSKTIADSLPQQMYIGSLPLPSGSPPFPNMTDSACNFTDHVSANVVEHDSRNMTTDKNFAFEEQTDRLIRLGIERCREKAAVKASEEDAKQVSEDALPLAVAAAAVSYRQASKQTEEQEEKVNSKIEQPEENVVAAETKTLVNRDIAEQTSRECKVAANGYMFRPRVDDDSRKRIIDEEYADVESPSSQSDVMSEEEDEGSDSDSYWPKSERSGQRGHVCGTGSKLGNTAHSPQLWEFLLMVLDDTSKKSVMAWKDKGDGVFKIYNSGSAAKLWGRHKNKGNMNYDKMSRAMRYYYGKGIFEKVPGRLVYKFSQEARKKYANNKANMLYNRSIPQAT